jgi:hypothetical protein
VFGGRVLSQTYTRSARQKTAIASVYGNGKGDEQLSHARLERCLEGNKQCEFELRFDYSEGKRCVFMSML